MSYVLVGILVLILAGAFVAFLVLASRKRSIGGDDSAAGDAGDAGAPGIGADEAPFGDTTEHAGTTSAEGETVGDQDAEHAGGSGRPVLSGDAEAPAEAPAAPGPERRFQRDPGGGEAEARPFTDG